LTATSVTVNVGTGSATFTATTRAFDNTPNAFSFTSQNGVALNTAITSNTVTVGGLEPNAIIAVVVSGGLFDAGTTALSGTFGTTGRSITTTASGTLVVAARVTSSSSFNTSTSCTVTVGTRSETFTVTTSAFDATLETGFIQSITFASGININTVTRLPASGTRSASTVTPSTSFTLTRSSGTALIDAGTPSLSGSFASSKTFQSSSSGTFVWAASQTSSNRNFHNLRSIFSLSSGGTAGSDIIVDLQTKEAVSITGTVGATLAAGTVKSRTIVWSNLAAGSITISIGTNSSGGTGRYRIDGGVWRTTAHTFSVSNGGGFTVDTEVTAAPTSGSFRTFNVSTAHNSGGGSYNFPNQVTTA
jgi:hypothetical protein